jgi:hypothetical protein
LEPITFVLTCLSGTIPLSSQTSTMIVADPSVTGFESDDSAYLDCIENLVNFDPNDVSQDGSVTPTPGTSYLKPFEMPEMNITDNEDAWTPKSGTSYSEIEADNPWAEVEDNTESVTRETISNQRESSRMKKRANDGLLTVSRVLIDVT